MEQKVLACDDGGLYFCTQRTGANESGDVVWFGTKGAKRSRLTNRLSSATFANVFWGRAGDGQTYEQFEGEWWDVPYAATWGHGTMECRFSSQGGFVRGAFTGGFGGSRWSPAGGTAYMRNLRWMNPYPVLTRYGRSQPLTASHDLTGVWTTENESLYFVRQLGDTVVWFSSQRRRDWANVFKGTLSGDRLTGAWIDIPYGGRSALGRLTLELHGGESPFAMRRVPTGSSYEDDRWLKVAG